jgi:acetyltransferase-like isoleucine patch superfamily enzyme
VLLASQLTSWMAAIRRFRYEMKIIDNGKENLFIGEKAFGDSGSALINGSRNKIEVGEQSNLQAFKIEIHGDDCQVLIGEGCKFRGSAKLQGKGANLIIGNFSTGSGVKFLAMEGRSIRLGEDCMLSFNIEIRTSDAHALLDRQTMRRINLPSDVVIEDHVWVGARTFIGKGSYIGHDNIIAQGSLVNKKFYVVSSVIAGCPAKVCKSGVTWARDPETGM